MTARVAAPIRLGWIGIGVLALAGAPAAGAQGGAEPPADRAEAASPPARAWVSAGYGISSTAGGMGRIAAAASFSRAMVAARQVSIRNGFDEDGRLNDVGLLVGLRTLGKSFLSGAIGAARVRHTPDFCPSPNTCAPSTSGGFTYEVGAQAATSWVSFGATFAETRAGNLTSWQGFSLSIGLGKFR